jgi:hypothetical protein
MKPFEVALLRLERSSQGARRQATEMRWLDTLRSTAQKKKISSQSISRFFFLLALILRENTISYSCRPSLSYFNEVDGDFYGWWTGRTTQTTQDPALLSAIGSCGITLPSRSSAGQLCPSSARSSRNHTRARPSGRNRRPACAHRRERKEAPKIET